MITEPDSVAASTISSSGQRSPLVLYSESTTTTPGPCLAASLRRASELLCRKGRATAPALRTPSHKDMWANMSM